jgi:hypothetical protein
VIERYLEELGRALRGSRAYKRRVLAEVEDHLRESTRAVGEREAVARFGPPHALARDFARGLTALRRAGLTLLLALSALSLTLYPIPENTLPPATWSGDTPPFYLRWKMYAAGACFFISVAAALISLSAAHLGRFRTSSGALAVGVFALAAHAVLMTVVGVQWAAEVPGSGLTLALTAALDAAALTAAGWAAASAFSLRRRLAGSRAGRSS